MLVPTVQFKYSSVYDMTCHQLHNDAEDGAYPTTKEVQLYMQQVQQLWSGIEKDVLTELSTIAGLPWHDSVIPCYIVGSIIPFSDPLTMPVYKDAPDYGIDVLVHELIHQLFTQGDNLERAKGAWDYIDDVYKKESDITRIHIPLHAIHAHMYHIFFSEERLERDIEWISFISDYKQSWGIVQKEGYENIVETFRRKVVVV